MAKMVSSKGSWFFCVVRLSFFKLPSKDLFFKHCKTLIITLRVTQKALQLPLCFFSSVFPSRRCFGWAVKSFLANLSSFVTQEISYQDRTYFIGRTKKECVEIVPLVVIREAFGTWQSYSRQSIFTVSEKAQETARNSETSYRLGDDRRF